MKLYNKFFLLLMVNVALSSHIVWGMEGPQRQEPPFYFSSNQQISLYTRYIDSLSERVFPDKPQLQDAIKRAEWDHLIQFPDGGSVDVRIKADYLITRVDTLTNLYDKLIAIDETQTRSCYIKTVQRIEESLAELDLYPSHLISSDKGLLYSKLGKSHNKFITYLQYTQESILLVPKEIATFKKALQFLPKQPDFFLEMIAQVHAGLSCAYCFQAKVQDLDANLAQARYWRDQIKGFPALYNSVNAAIQLREMQSYGHKSRGERHARLKHRTGHTATTNVAPILGLFKKGVEREVPSGARLLEHRSKLFKLLNNKNRNPGLIIASVKEIEATIGAHFNLSPEKDLKTIYEKYKNMLHDERGILFPDSMLAYITAFAENNDRERAQQLTDILVSLTSEGNGSLSSRIIYAGIKNLSGDPTLWLALEKEQEEKAAQQAKKRKEKKKRQKQQIFNKIKAAQDVQKQRKVSLEAAAFKPLKQKEKVGAAAVDDVTEKFFEPQNPNYKAEKGERHAAAQADRVNAQQLNKDDEKCPEAPPIAHAEKAIEVNAQAIPNPNLKIQDFYPLKGRPRKIDRAIEEGAWDFTRAEMETYFEALGCKNKSGKGSHGKSSLPKSVHVMCGEELITIFNEFGGALTLPEWEDAVPYYLRGQILLARQKLIFIAFKASQLA
ncbi:MAG: hypothetical protein K0R52_1126 [Alphaproteobacteria bacterium]|jgi:hypothetical protein|nr:hypothetical protein [Alphaproteobacteria bacterium]